MKHLDNVVGILAHQWALFSLALLLAGCAVDVVSPDDPFSAIPDRSSGIKVGQTERGAVRDQLGMPILSSPYWRFDLYRTDTEQSDVVLAVTPLPIPFARIKDQLHRYTLVAYDTNGLVSAVSTGLFRKPAAWRNTSPIQSDYPSLHLRSADILIFVDPEGARDLNLLVAPAGRDAFFKRALTSNNCLVVLGCGDRGCGDQLTVDAESARRLPLRNAHTYWLRNDERSYWLRDLEPYSVNVMIPWLESLVAINLTPGDHVLELSAKYLGGRHALKFACHAGDVSFLVVNATDNGSFMKHALVDWVVKRAEVMPEQFARRPLVLVDDGKWYADAEPADFREKNW